MITRTALYDFIDTLIEASTSNDALFEAEVFRNLRTSVDDAVKIVRVETFTGEHNLSTEDHRKELLVEATIQCWVTPDGDDQIAIDEATDLSFEMSRQIFRAIAAGADLNGLVCDSAFSTFETGEANLGTVRRGVTYLDGIINQAS